MKVLVRVLSSKGERAIKIADVICGLVLHGAELGELEYYAVFDPHFAIVGRGRRMPRQWLDRLARAIEIGAVDEMPAERIVEILLQPLPQRESESV